MVKVGDMVRLNDSIDRQVLSSFGKVVALHEYEKIVEVEIKIPKLKRTVFFFDDEVTVVESEEASP